MSSGMSVTSGFAVFGTPLGHGGIAWRAGTVVRSLLPEDDAGAVRSRLAAAVPDGTEGTEGAEGAVPDSLRHVIDGVVSLLRGDAVDLSEVPLDLASVPAFQRSVYEFVRTIPVGHTVTYGDVATHIGEPGAARAVGRALGANPFAPIVPCHRVLAAGGAIGGFSGPGGVSTKQRLLAIERAHGDQPALFDL
ncbi:methylated-DNA--[protein]-cysteine S-methyltransferase [Saccharomonospora xinjiangensis]|uniref:methylated-DNA--[protein]-cysteine S-methyltransferase n=1 Tax=Saccharomonospora xinjiangensis TaxID=75294 RepID=UPI0010C46FF1|nr:methylated-DNA--[protein]-cysteine S-methyltransferase [Saccharomonospora xinjiangensis]QBQ59187.1 Methylated-DNA--protein-cysteine methyltransferase [Saccharomonospora xinjiangensis]